MRQIKQSIKRIIPKKIWHQLFNIRRSIKRNLRREDFLRKKYQWESRPAGIDLARKKYKSYSEYLKHQKSKLATIKEKWLPEYDIKYRVALRKRLEKAKIVKPKMSVLCLAARIGTEVKSFLDLGCFAVGLDINPGKNNKYVVYGDFHDIQFVDNSVDVIFTNSLDHVFDFDRFIKEIKRVLKPGGFLILEIFKGRQEGMISGYYESVAWDKINDVLDIFTKSGFKVVAESDFTFPWKGGRHVSLSLSRNVGSKI